MICAPSHMYGRGRVCSLSYVLPLIVVAGGCIMGEVGCDMCSSHSGGCMGEVGCDMCSPLIGRVWWLPLIVVAVWERSGVICGPLIVVAVLWERSGVICAPSHSGGCMGEVGCDMCSLS